MKFNPDKLAIWIERKASSYLEWGQRRTQTRFKKALRVKRSFWILLGLCSILLLGFMDHVNAGAIRSACALGFILALLKFVQLTMIALHGKEGTDK
jgi:hypothetical protein